MRRIPLYASAAITLCILVYADAAGTRLAEGEGMAMMESLGLRGVQEDVDKAMWEAKQAQEEEDAEDEEIARMMAELEGLDQEKNAAEAEAKKKDLEAKEATAAKLKAVAAQKAAQAEAALKEKARQVELAALAAQKEAEAAIAATKALRASAAKRMQEAKLASAEYENSIASGDSKDSGALEAKAQKAMSEAQALSSQAGQSSEAATQALTNAAKTKEKADKVLDMEKEGKAQLMNQGLTWVGGPIFSKMKRLCEIDYPTFRKEYDKIRNSPLFKKHRWDIKKACSKSLNDSSLEDEDAVAKRNAEAEAKKEEDAKVDANVDPSKPYPAKNLHWKLPADKKVKKWCTTKFGAVPCSMLAKAREAGLLGESNESGKLDNAPEVDPLDESSAYELSELVF